MSAAPGAAPFSRDRAAIRRAMFLSQDGVALCMTLRGLDQIGALVPSLEGERSLDELVPGLDAAGFGALRAALHGLLATGWAAGRPGLDPTTTALRWTDAGRAAMARCGAYLDNAELLARLDKSGAEAWTGPWDERTGASFADLVRRRRLERGDGGPLVDAHLDGALIVPTLLWLHETGRLGDEAPALPDGESGAAMAELLGDLAWLDERSAWTEVGDGARRFALHFGGVATYLPLFARLPEIYRGELTVVPDPGSGAPEWHVHRALNVRISSAAHRRYFADSEPVFREIFDREPLAEQPRFVADMGCGQGSWLAYLHRLIGEGTARGRDLDRHPLLMIGVDPDPTALAEARAALDAAGVPALLLRGDVTDPDGLRDSLAEHGIAIEDGLHIRSFIDHERTYRGGSPAEPVPDRSSGTYLDPAGAALSGADVERDLVAHLRRWVPHAGRHGMVVLESHCTAPEVVARNLGSMHGLAFDAHHAYSKQYPVDHAAWLACCRAAGLRTVAQDEIRYPARRPFVSISLNRLVAAGPPDHALPAIDPAAERADTWRPDPDVNLEDGEALHRILFADGDIRFPAPWCAAATGTVVGGALAEIEARLAESGPGGTIEVLDYGAGTGTATIELLKACRERSIDRALSARETTLVVHLVDLPSSWYAKGYELLGECAWTRFHSLRADGGGFRAPADLVGPCRIDVAMVNMVLHLIPPRALARISDGLAAAMRPGGRLLWSAPDLGPAPPGTVLLHDPNRLLRERWLQLLDGERHPASALAEIVARARSTRDPAGARAAQERADRRIRPRPLASEVVEALGRHFDGATENAAYEMLGEDIVAGLLVPSNQAEFLPEIDDRGDRETVIRRLMVDEVIPELRAGPAATGLGLSFHWVLGDHRRLP